MQRKRGGINMKVKWVKPEPGSENDLSEWARLLWPELYALETEADEVLKAAAAILGEPTVDAKKAEALRRKAELETELAAINASLDTEVA